MASICRRQGEGGNDYFLLGRLWQPIRPDVCEIDVGQGGAACKSSLEIMTIDVLK